MVRYGCFGGASLVALFARRSGGGELNVDDRTRLDPTFFSVPTSRWQDVSGDTVRELTRINIAIGLALADMSTERSSDVPSGEGDFAVSSTVLPPAQLALRMHEVAGQILAATAADEQNLRQIITTLRTGLAVCWDLYSVRESETVTVFEHMKNLRSRIEDFERELVAARQDKTNEAEPEDVPLPD